MTEDLSQDYHNNWLRAHDRVISIQYPFLIKKKKDKIIIEKTL